MARRGSNLSGGRRGSWDLKGRVLAAWVVEGNAYLMVVAQEFGRLAVEWGVDAVGEHLDRRTVGDLVSLMRSKEMLGPAPLLALRAHVPLEMPLRAKMPRSDAVAFRPSNHFVPRQYSPF